LLFFTNFSFSQLDTVLVQTEFSQPINVDSTQLNFQELKVKIWVNDFDFVGQYIVELYNAESEYPIIKLKFSKQEIIDNSMKNSLNWTIIPMGLFDPNLQYTLKTIVRNYQLAELPIIQTQIN
jgi:hypothetical protein